MLDLDDRFKVKVRNPEKCIGCLMCEMRCPDMAIFAEKGSRGLGVKGSSEDAAQKDTEGAEGKAKS